MGCYFGWIYWCSDGYATRVSGFSIFISALLCSLRICCFKYSSAVISVNYGNRCNSTSYSNLHIDSSVIIMLIFIEPIPVQSLLDVGLFLTIGLFGGIGVLCLIACYRLIEPVRLLPLNTSLFRYLFTWLVFFLRPPSKNFSRHTDHNLGRFDNYIARKYSE